MLGIVTYSNRVYSLHSFLGRTNPNTSMPVRYTAASVLDGCSPDRPQGSRTDSHDNSPRFSKTLRLARALPALPDERANSPFPR